MRGSSTWWHRWRRSPGAWRSSCLFGLTFEPRLVELHIDMDAIDQAFKELTGNLSDLDKDQLAKTAAKMAVLVKSPERIQRIRADIARHFQEKVTPSGFGAQVVTFDRESCLLYKRRWTSTCLLKSPTS
jgi:type I restriction enzyme, R subunit